jgi:hypothetical protein
MVKSDVSCGPSGIMIMKSMMCVRLIAAKVQSSQRSWRGDKARGRMGRIGVLLIRTVSPRFSNVQLDEAQQACDAALEELQNDGTWQKIHDEAARNLRSITFDQMRQFGISDEDAQALADAAVNKVSAPIADGCPGSAAAMDRLMHELMRKRRAAPKFSHPPRGAWRKATGLGVLLSPRSRECLMDPESQS